jgi:hypothetical protein
MAVGGARPLAPRYTARTKQTIKSVANRGSEILKGLSGKAATEIHYRTGHLGLRRHQHDPADVRLK